MLTLTFLGVGAAFAKRNFQSNALIEAWTSPPTGKNAPDDVLLVDFGATGPIAMYSLMHVPGFSYLNRDGRINYPAIRNILITHLHTDHVGGLEELAAMNMHFYADEQTGKGARARLIGTEEVLDQLWNHTLRGGLGAVHGRCAELVDYFDVLTLDADVSGASNGLVLLNRYKISLFSTDHIRIQQKRDWPSFGLLITDQATGHTAFYSGDTRFDADLGAMMAASRINFHEVQLEEQPDPVHAMLSELRTLPEGVRQKTLLYHFSDQWNSGSYDFVANEFAGFAQPRVRYTLFD